MVSRDSEQQLFLPAAMCGGLPGPSLEVTGLGVQDPEGSPSVFLRLTGVFHTYPSLGFFVVPTQRSHSLKCSLF